MDYRTPGARSTFPRRDLLGAGGAALLLTSTTACDLLGTDPEESEPQQAARKEREAPMLAARVKDGDLPPLEDRLPTNPVVVQPVDQVGVYGGTWRTVLSGGADTAWLTRTMGYEYLLRWTPDWSDIIPNIAESVEESEDAREFTIKLREGMRWSDGEPFTAADLVFAWDDVLLNEELRPAPPALVLSGDGEPGTIEQVDDYNVRIVFPGTAGLFRVSLTYPGSQILVQSPRHYLQDFHADYNPDVQAEAEDEGFAEWIELFGSRSNVWENADLPRHHPWVITTELGEGTRVVLERNPYYFKTDPDGSQLPYIDEVIFEVVSDEEVMLLMATNGELDFHSRHFNTFPNKPVLAANRESGGYHFVDVINEQANIMFLGFNMAHQDPVKHEVFNNRDFRIGLSYAINREEVIDTVYQRQGEPWQVAPRRESELFDEEMAKQYTEYDVDQANEYLDRAGYSGRDGEGRRQGPDGNAISFTVSVPTGLQPAWQDTLELFEGYWREVGVAMRINALERSLWTERNAANEQDAAVWHADGGLDWELVIRPWAYIPFYDTYSFWGTPWAAWYNSAGQEGQEPPEWVRRQLDLYDELKATAGQAEQFALMREILAIDKEEFHAIGTSLYPAEYAIVKNSFHNVPSEFPMAGGVYPAPGPTNPEQYFISDTN